MLAPERPAELGLRVLAGFGERDVSPRARIPDDEAGAPLNVLPAFDTTLPSQARAVAVKAPTGIGPVARAAWDDAVRDLTAMGEDPERCKLLLAALVHAVDDQARARIAWKRSGYAADKGSTGQPVPSLHWRTITECDDKIVTLARELGLSPKARRDLRRSVGRPPGAASAADRRMPGEPPRRRLRAVD